MSIIVPAQTAPMPQGIAPQPSRLLETPPEGWKRISGVVNWPYAGLTAIAWDCSAGQGSNAWSCVRSIYVDNLDSDADVYFIDTSTLFQLKVPAGNEGLYPVEMSGSKFIVSAPNAASGDSVSFQAYNYLPPPVSVTPPYLVSAVSTGNINFAIGNTAIIPAGTNGILTGVTVSASNAEAGAGLSGLLVEVFDGSAIPVLYAEAILYVGPVAGGGYVGFQQLINVNQNVRFKNGLYLGQNTIASPWVTGSLTATAYYR